jgi:hypothetical protein
MLTGVNIETKSQVASVITAASSLAGALRTDNEGDKKDYACNSAPRLRGMKVMRLEEMQNGNANRTP